MDPRRVRLRLTVKRESQKMETRRVATDFLSQVGYNLGNPRSRTPSLDFALGVPA